MPVIMAAGVFEMQLNTELLKEWLIRGVVLLTCLPIHEFAHAFTANLLGDNTAEKQGRLSLNPFVHLELMGSALMILAGFGWAKPVPVGARNFKSPRRDMALTAAAGPLSNILLAMILMSVYKVIIYRAARAASLPGWFDTAMELLIIMVVLNTQLAVFNLLPVPPLDGSKLFGAIMPDRFYFAMLRYERYVIAVVFLLIYFRVLSTPLQYLTGQLLSFLNFVTTPVDILMGG